MADSETLGPARLACERDVLAEPAMTSLQLTCGEDPGHTARLTQLLAGGHYHDPQGRYDFCTDPRCPRVSGKR